MPRRFSLPTLLGALAIVGCSHGHQVTAQAKTVSDVPPTETPKPADSMDAARDNVSKGAFSLTAATSDIQDAMDQAKTLRSKTPNMALKQALDDVIASLDDAGGSIADYSVEPPPLAEFKATFANQDDKRLKAIDAGNDALHDVDDANGTLNGITESLAGTDAAGVDDIQSTLDDATNDLTEAVTNFGGRVEKPDDEADSATPDASGNGSTP